MKWFNKSQAINYETREKSYTLPSGTSEWKESDWNFFYSKKKEEIDLLIKTGSLISLDVKKEDKPSNSKSSPSGKDK